jgi:hypothetical protein
MAKCMHDECSCEAETTQAPYCSAHCRERALRTRPSISATTQDKGAGCGCGHPDCD